MGSLEIPNYYMYNYYDLHLDMTKDRRLGKSQLLPNFQRSSQEVASSTRAGWIKKILRCQRLILTYTKLIQQL